MKTMKLMMAVAAFALASGNLQAKPPAGEEWHTCTVHTVPEGAAISVGHLFEGQEFIGYSPVSFRFKTTNGYVQPPILIYCTPTAAGQHTQHGNIGAYGARITGDGSCTFFMFNERGY